MNTEQEAVEENIPKVTYFDARGRAEVIRILLEETNPTYHERRISIEEWPEL